jgi:hypothetical protein
MTRKGEPRTELQVETDYEKESRMYLLGYTQAQIARAVGLTQQQVSLDLQVIKERLREQSTGNMKEWRDNEVSLTRFYEQEMLREWDKSKRPKKLSGKKKVESTGGEEDGTREEEWERTEGQRGDPRYIERAQTAQAQRIKLLGLEPEAPTPPSPGVSVHVSVESKRIILELRERIINATPEEQDVFIAEYEAFQQNLTRLGRFLPAPSEETEQEPH